MFVIEAKHSRLHRAGGWDGQKVGKKKKTKEEKRDGRGRGEGGGLPQVLPLTMETTSFLLQAGWFRQQDQGTIAQRHEICCVNRCEQVHHCLHVQWKE